MIVVAWSLVCVPVALAWPGAPAPVRQAGTQHPYGVPTTHADLKSGTLLGVYDMTVASWTRLAATPESATVSVAEARRLGQPWQATLVNYGGVFHVNPVSTCELALGDYTRYFSTGDPRFLQYFRDAADWLVAEQQADGSWRYDFAYGDLAPGWSSGMAQGLAISVLCRAYQQTDTVAYLRAARRAFSFMNRPVAAGGDLGALPDGVPLFEEYPNSVTYADVLNGSIFALWGVHDLYRATADPGALADWKRISVLLPRVLKLYDTGSWTLYDPTATHPVSLTYMRVHDGQMFAMKVLTGDPRYGEYASKWLGYLAASSAARRPATAGRAVGGPAPVISGLDEPAP